MVLEDSILIAEPGIGMTPVSAFPAPPVEKQDVSHITILQLGMAVIVGAVLHKSMIMSVMADGFILLIIMYHIVLKYVRLHADVVSDMMHIIPVRVKKCSRISNFYHDSRR